MIILFINVAIGILAHKNRFLFVRRKEGNFPNLWGLAGGKVDDGEHISETIVREIKEETDLEVKFDRVLGLSTEMVTDNNKTISTVLYCCLIELMYSQSINRPLGKSWFSKNENLELKWFTKDEIYSREDIIISDLFFLKHFYYQKDKNYIQIDCKRDRNGQYTWKVV